LILGVPRVSSEKSQLFNTILFNSALLIDDGKIQQAVHKKLLPNYEIFHERRYFRSDGLTSPEDFTFSFLGKKIAVFVCEDLLGIEHNYNYGPWEEDFSEIDLAVCLSASPYRVGQIDKRISICQNIQRRTNLQAPLILVNQVGANDDLIFDGSSFVLGGEGEIEGLAKSFIEDVLLIDTSPKSPQRKITKTTTDPILEKRKALVLGIKDYFKKSGFDKAILGLSGGIDSALVCCLAIEALGIENVCMLLMPSDYSTDDSLRDAHELIDRWGVIDYRVIPISTILKEFMQMGEFSSETLTEENLQARIRGSLLMAEANEQRALVLATGNKSELAVGYSTLYGDSCGSLLPIGDLWKTDVWEMARSYSEIPSQIINKEPSAELRPKQKDSDSLPPYHILDDILQGYVEQGMSLDEITEKGHDPEVTKMLIERLHRNEFKRKQSPIILKVSNRSFSHSEWLLPIAKSLSH